MLILDPCIDRIVGQDSRGGGWTELVLKIFSSLTYTVEFLNLDIDAKLQCVARHDKTGTNSVTFFWSSQTVFLIGPHTPGLAAVCGPIRKKLQRSPFTLTRGQLWSECVRQRLSQQFFTKTDNFSEMKCFSKRIFQSIFVILLNKRTYTCFTIVFICF